METRKVLAVAGVAAILLLAGGSAVAGSPAGGSAAAGTCLTEVASAAPVVASPKAQRLLAKLVPTDSIEVTNALGTAMSCADQVGKAVRTPAVVKERAGKVRLHPDGVPKCAVP